MRKYLVEFIGTFFLMLSIVMAIQLGLKEFVPLAVGAMLTAMIYAGGHISNAHYNPAITLVFFLRGKCDKKDVLPYVLAQILGVMLAVFVNSILLEHTDKEIPAQMNLVLWPALLAEFLGTFALAYVILNVATAKTLSGNGFYGAAIGLVVVACAYLFGSISGGAFNPAVGLGLILFGLVEWSAIWIYLLPSFSAAFIAFLVFRYLNGGND